MTSKTPIEKHVLGLSGGRDSAALAVFMRQQYPDLELEYFFTDTGKELPEVYEFLGRLEGFLGRPILRLNPEKDFDFWHREYGHFLPSPRTRWCTRQLKLRPFQEWIKPDLEAGTKVVSYVAIRADEPQRIGMHATHPNLEIRFPFREHAVDKAGVLDLLDSSDLGLPTYYRWRSRSGCTFCFYQQKIEWVRLREEHPDKYEEAKMYEKNALEHGSPFTWSDRESLEDLERPERIAEIKTDYRRRLERERKRKPVNPLREGIDDIDIDEAYGLSEVAASCVICHK
jgi:Phosphoadenosine phosphosulfate reductase family